MIVNLDNIYFTQKELIFILATITDLGQKDLEDKILLFLTGEQEL